MRSLSEKDERNAKLMTRLYRYQWTILKTNPDLTKYEACYRTLTENGFKHNCYVNNHCFLCLHMLTIRAEEDEGYVCELCPIEWPKLSPLPKSNIQHSTPCEKSYYAQWDTARLKLYEITPSECASLQKELSRLAGVISRLPEKEES